MCSRCASGPDQHLVTGAGDEAPGRDAVVCRAVLDPVQIPGKPSVHHLHGRRAAMSALMEIDLQRDAFGLERLVNSNAVLRDDVPVIECVRHQGGGLQCGVHHLLALLLQYELHD